jgi:hypothetical protein
VGLLPFEMALVFQEYSDKSLGLNVVVHQEIVPHQRHNATGAVWQMMEQMYEPVERQPSETQELLFVALLQILFQDLA